MITDAFDKSEVLFGPKDFYGEQKHLCDKCIITFSERIFDYMLETYAHEEAGSIRCCNGNTTVYIFEIEGMKIAGYLSHIGSASAGGDVIDVNWLTGASKFIMFGSAGSLDSDATNGKFVIPTESYREEGLSYNYIDPTDYIKIKNSKMVKAIFDEFNLPSVTGKVWTTDAIYRETKAKLEARKAEGCVAVEMELAGVQAVCDYYGWDLYDFLVTGDVLDKAVYDVSGLANANHNMDKLYIAIEIAKRI
jgi:uridine phosphorylase